MAFDDIRPLLSGLLGGAAAIALGAAVARWMPKSFQGKSADRLVHENRAAVKVANLLLFIGIFGSLALYSLFDLPHNDWRPLALGFGFALSAPLVSLLLSSIVAKRHPGEALVAFALSQKLPVPIILPLLTLGIPLFFLAIWGFLR